MKRVLICAVLAFSVNATDNFGMDFESEDRELAVDDSDSDDCWPAESPQKDDQCVGRGAITTDLSFWKAKIVENKLHEDGVLRYSNIGKVDNKDVDLVVSVQPGTKYTSSKAEKNNGKSGKFGSINLYTKYGDLESGQGNFRFCWTEKNSDKKVTVPSFRWTVYDVDERNQAPNGIKEKLIMDTTQAEDFFLWPNLKDTQIRGNCESGKAPPCGSGDRMIFHSTRKGTSKDNPRNPNRLTSIQKKRSIVFYFKDTDCWDFTYEHYCKLEEEKGDKCSWYGGGNFMFAGDSEDIVNDGVCIVTKDEDKVADATLPPTKSPTTSPTGSPTSFPTASPTVKPTVSPTTGPTGGPTGGPTEEPTTTPTAEPTNGPTEAPTATPTSAPFTPLAATPASSVINSPADSPEDPSCLGKTKMETELDFFNSKLTKNSLHEGGIMKFEDIGIVRDRPVDLIVTVVPGTTYESERAEIRNGKNGKFGNINLYTKLGDFESGQGNFRFCFHDHETQEKTTVDSFVWSVYDVDERNAAANGIKEKMIMDLSKVHDYMLWPNADETEIKLFCEDTKTAPPCADGERTVFHSSTHGVGGDNPNDPDNMTSQQKKRSIVFSFKDTDCWDFTYEHYCRLEEETGKECRWYGGGNFLFAGNAQEIIEGGECLTPAPTEEPKVTLDPTLSATLSPTPAPTPKWDKRGESPNEDDGRILPPPACPSDVKVLKTMGVTEFPPVETKSAIQVLSKNVEDNTVTVALNQAWRTDSIHSIHYQWQPNFFSEKCLQVTDVVKDETYAEITLQCHVLKPMATAMICLAEPLEKGFLQPEDNANIPKCCNHGEVEEIPVVCYQIEVQCTPGCANDDAEQKLRLLRGSM